MRNHRGGNANHLHEGNRSLLHSGASGDRSRQQWESFTRCAFKCINDPDGGANANRPGKKAELADDYCDFAALDQTFTGDDCFIDARLRSRRTKLSQVFRSRSDGINTGVIPGAE
ncbi:hypothetical protein GALL_514280 [mine drainage metagenome]|uniref:Uncharacterized protein n=1 Tax=mine drainage metagenome TaxID=410659 RepID=A0A1J5PTW5_9ZZZZ